METTVAPEILQLILLGAVTETCKVTWKYFEFETKLCLKFCCWNLTVFMEITGCVSRDLFFPFYSSGILGCFLELEMIALAHWMPTENSDKWASSSSGLVAFSLKKKSLTNAAVPRLSAADLIWSFKQGLKILFLFQLEHYHLSFNTKRAFSSFRSKHPQTF